VTYDPERHHRRSIRLRDYDYAQAGAYFVTICTHERRCLFGRIGGGEVRLSSIGRIVEEEWRRTADVRPDVDLDAFVVMPNHIHGIIVLTRPDFLPVGATRWVARSPTPTPRSRTPPKGPPPGSLGAIVSQVKSVVTKRVARSGDDATFPLWQRSFYEHVVRNDRQLERFRTYVIANPAVWTDDGLHPDNSTKW